MGGYSLILIALTVAGQRYLRERESSERRTIRDRRVTPLRRSSSIDPLTQTSF